MKTLIIFRFFLVSLTLAIFVAMPALAVGDSSAADVDVIYVIENFNGTVETAEPKIYEIVSGDYPELNSATAVQDLKRQEAGKGPIQKEYVSLVTVIKEEIVDKNRHNDIGASRLKPAVSEPITKNPNEVSAIPLERTLAISAFSGLLPDNKKAEIVPANKVDDKPLVVALTQGNIGIGNPLAASLLAKSYLQNTADNGRYYKKILKKKSFMIFKFTVCGLLLALLIMYALWFSPYAVRKKNSKYFYGLEKSKVADGVDEKSFVGFFVEDDEMQFCALNGVGQFKGRYESLIQWIVKNFGKNFEKQIFFDLPDNFAELVKRAKLNIEKIAPFGDMEKKMLIEHVRMHL